MTTRPWAGTPSSYDQPRPMAPRTHCAACKALPRYRSVTDALWRLLCGPHYEAAIQAGQATATDYIMMSGVHRW